MYLYSQFVFIKPIRSVELDIRNSQDSAGGVATCYGLDGLVFKSPAGIMYSLLQSFAGLIRAAPTLRVSGWEVSSDRDVKLITHLLLVPRLRTSGAVLLLPFYAIMAWTGGALF